MGVGKLHAHCAGLQMTNRVQMEDCVPPSLLCVMTCAGSEAAHLN